MAKNLILVNTNPDILKYDKQAMIRGMTVTKIPLCAEARYVF